MDLHGALMLVVPPCLETVQYAKMNVVVKYFKLDFAKDYARYFVYIQRH
jgi:hypothetical protein